MQQAAATWTPKQNRLVDLEGSGEYNSIVLNVRNYRRLLVRYTERNLRIFSAIPQALDVSNAVSLYVDNGWVSGDRMTCCSCQVDLNRKYQGSTHLVHCQVNGEVQAGTRRQELSIDKRCREVTV